MNLRAGLICIAWVRACSRVAVARDAQAWQAAVKDATLKGITEAEMLAIFHYITGQDGGKMKKEQLVEAIAALPHGDGAGLGGRQTGGAVRRSAASSVSNAPSSAADRGGVDSASIDGGIKGRADSAGSGGEVGDEQAVRLRVEAVTCLALLVSAAQVRRAVCLAASVQASVWAPGSARHRRVGPWHSGLAKRAAAHTRLPTTVTE